MTRAGLGEQDVRTAALALRDTTEQPSYGRPGFRVHDVLFARLVEPEVLLVWRETLEEKAALLDHDPAKFFTTAHYDGHPSVLVRLSAVDPDELAELLVESWQARAPARVRVQGAMV
ncbi:MAG: MmcQ/YjbR family DNA-binding protein [Propionibacteriaceae bacterium]